MIKLQNQRLTQQHIIAEQNFEESKKKKRKMPILRALLKICKNTHQKNPMKSNTLMTIGLLGAGDLITQYIEIKFINSPKYDQFKLPSNAELWEMTKSTFDIAKISHMLKNSSKLLRVKEKSSKEKEEESFWAQIDWKRAAKLSAVGLVMGPFCHKWYSFLDKIFPTKTGKIILCKVLLDQILAAPAMNLMSIAGCFDYTGKSVGDAVQFVKDKFMTIYTYDCAVWPAAQVINFIFVSPVYRVMYVNGVSLLWNSVLSFLMFEEQE